jgi:hypothetical protein
MHHRIELLRLEQLIKRRPVGDVALHEVTGQHRIAKAPDEAVQRGHAAALPPQKLHHVRADVARSPHHQNVHHVLFPTGTKKAPKGLFDGAERISSEKRGLQA